MTQLQLEFTEAEKARAQSNTDRILHRLQEGPALSTELIEFTHRFSACIRNLRVQGYEINVEKLDDGTSLHSLRGYTPLVEVTDEMKSAYYLTTHWQAKRQERMSFDGFRCCHCKSQQLLQVHHWVYELFAESIEDLMTLCDQCHERMHKYEAVKMHFPKFVSQSIADALRHVTSEVAQ